MALPEGRDEALAAEWVRFRDLTTAGKSEEAFQPAERIIASSADPYLVAQALVETAVAHYGARNWDALLPLVAKIEEQLRTAAHPRLVGQYHILAGAFAYERGSMGIALRHLIEAGRALQRMTERTRAAVDAWHDLAAIYSKLGYHAQALEAAQRCQSLAADAGLAAGLGIAVYAYVAAAVVLDQRGDTDDCVRELTELVERCRPFVADLAVVHRIPLRYALRRLAALDHPIALDVPAIPDPGPFLKPISILTDACDALSARRPEQTIAIIDTAACPLDSFGTAEPLRLRSLALAQMGDYNAALATERAVLRRANREERALRRLLAAAAGAYIDQEQLRRSAERHARAALTDPLTGLPNRRKIDEFTANLTEAGKTATIGVLDLDGFKAINDNHGHPTGDLILQRIAGILAREVGPTDLVARQGGDEFVVVLPDSTKIDAETLGERIEAAIRNEEWHSAIPGTPLGVSIGWAEFDGDLSTTFDAADAALYANKRMHHTETDSE